jgi:trans-aconitate 2-methyltransferase
MVEEAVTTGGYAEATFSGRSGSAVAFLGAVTQRLADRKGIRILELGCGTGDVALAMAERNEDHKIVGLDLSASNVALAESLSTKLHVDKRPTFQSGDYRSWSCGRFDVIVADSVIHLIAMDDRELVAKLSRDLAPGGLLIITMPDHCARNVTLMLLRRAWRLMPAGFDRVALAAARLLHSDEPSHILAERIGYLRIIPERLFDSLFVSRMEDAGLTLKEVMPWPGPSLLKPRHRFIVFGRRSS